MYVSKAKLIQIIRDPINRLISNFNTKNNPLLHGDYKAQGIDHYIIQAITHQYLHFQYSNYGQMLKNALLYYQTNQIFIIRPDKMKDDYNTAKK